VRHLEIALAAHRAWFEVAEAHLAGALRLTVGYRGGVRVFLNGKEIARAHLPGGALDPKTVAQAYRPEAYLILPGEEPDGLARKGEEPAFWPDLYGRFPEGLKPEKVRRYFPFPQPHEKKIWERVQGLRDRVLSLALPPKALRKDSNLLAIEVRRADLHPVVLAGKDYPWARNARQDVAWPHCALPHVELRATRPGVSPARAPAGAARLRASDIHTRLYDRDHLEAGVPARAAFAMGPRNGTAAAALVLETGRALAGPKASAGAFQKRGGRSALPASIARLYWLKPRAISEIRGRSGRMFSYASNNPHGYDGGAAEPLRAFDQLGRGAPERLCAGAIQPLWLSLRIPKDARPGLYEGKVRITAEGASLTLPVMLEVCGLAVPDPNALATFVAAEQSPYGVAKQYRAPLWSQRHFQLIGKSFAELARLGNRWLNLPAVCNTEFGNRDDTLIRWIRKKDGALRFDCTILDRYLDLALSVHKRIDVFNVVVISDGTVRITDEAGGKTNEVRLLHKDGLVAERREDWKAFAKALYAHFKKRGLERNLYWGMTWDNVKAPHGLKEAFAEAVPNVFWTRAGHNLHFDAFYKVSVGVYGIRWNPRFEGKGWKSRELALLSSRNALCPARDMSPYMAYRTFPDNALASGHRGIARLGADYWGVHMAGWKGGNRSRFPGFLTNALLWPGPEGAEPSVRLEILIEGLQETEARR